VRRNYTAIVHEHHDPQVLAEQVSEKKVRTVGRPEKSAGDNVDNINLKATGGGTSSSYLTARIARDNPGVLEDMKAGKYPSVRAPTCAAKPAKPPYNHCQKTRITQGQAGRR
jgi:hypothetical protein